MIFGCLFQGLFVLFLSWHWFGVGWAPGFVSIGDTPVISVGWMGIRTGVAGEVYGVISRPIRPVQDQETDNLRKLGFHARLSSYLIESVSLAVSQVYVRVNKSVPQVLP